MAEEKSLKAVQVVFLNQQSQRAYNFVRHTVFPQGCLLHAEFWAFVLLSPPNTFFKNKK